jgi:hypothetical protein
MGCFWIVESTPGMAVIESTFYWSSFWSFLNMFFWCDSVCFIGTQIQTPAKLILICLVGYESELWYSVFLLWLHRLLFVAHEQICFSATWSWWTSTLTCGVAKFGSESTEPKAILITLW